MLNLKRITFALSLICIFLVLAPTGMSSNKNAVVTTSPNPVLVGQSFDILACNFAGRYLYIEIIDPNGSEQLWEVSTLNVCGSPSMTYTDTVVAGTYQINVFKWSTHPPFSGGTVIASTTETVL